MGFNLGFKGLNVRIGVKHRVKHYKADASRTCCKRFAFTLYDFESISNKRIISGPLFLLSEMLIAFMRINA